MPKTAGDPRGTYRWKLMRRRLIAEATHCAICGRLLVKDAPPRSSLSPSVDHIVAISRGGEPFKASNLRIVHYSCNAGRREGGRQRQGPSSLPQPTSRDTCTPVRNADWW